MRCGEPNAAPGCLVQARYLYQVARGLPKEMVFAQILAGFEMASRDPRVVGLKSGDGRRLVRAHPRFQFAHGDD